MQNRDRIGIVGDNGVGKSTLLNLINGDLVPTAGVLDIGETVRIGYFSQQIKDMDESKRVINYLQEVADEVKTTVGTTSITELLSSSFFLVLPMEHRLLSSLVGKRNVFIYLRF